MAYYHIDAVRILRLILGFYVLVWFALIVPGHTRGAIVMPGSVASPACCTTPTSSDSGKSPCQSERSNCAVCYVTAMFSLPPVYVFYVQPLDLVQTLNDRSVPQILSIDYPTPFWPIGPPAAA